VTDPLRTEHVNFIIDAAGAAVTLVV
jgi:hypothetical protein